MKNTEKEQTRPVQAENAPLKEEELDQVSGGREAREMDMMPETRERELNGDNVKRNR